VVPSTLSGCVKHLHAPYRNPQTDPITRGDVYRISAAVAGIWYGAILFQLNTIWQAITNQWDVNEKQWKVNQQQSEIDGKMIDVIRDLSTNLELTNKSLGLAQQVQELVKAKPGRLRAAINALLGK
jgi:hypothetical protein